MKNESTRLHAIDFLKGVAILMIILVHSPQRLEGVNETVVKLTRFFESGCQLFFLLSGFSLTVSWNRRKQSKWEFYKARFLGIAPAYYFMIIFYFILNGVLSRLQCYVGFIQNASLRPVLYNVLFWHGFLVEGHNNVMPGGWYIGVAMFFYILFPFIIEGMEWLRNRMGKSLIVIPFVAFLLIRFPSVFILDVLLEKLKLTNVIYYQDILFNMPCFLFGIVLYYQYSGGQLFLSGKNKLICWIIVVISAGMAVYDYYVGGIFNRQFSIGLFFYIIFILALDGEKYRKEKKIYKCIEEMGKQSYYIYLVHFLFVWYGMRGIFRYLDLLPGNKTVKYICILGLLIPLIFITGRLFSHIDRKMKAYLRDFYFRRIGENEGCDRKVKI